MNCQVIWSILFQVIYLAELSLKLIELSKMFLERNQISIQLDIKDPFLMIDEIKIVLARCRDSHLKNAMLIDRKIESARSALDVLHSSRSADVGETYDKMGRLKRGQTRGRETEV